MWTNLRKKASRFTRLGWSCLCRTSFLQLQASDWESSENIAKVSQLEPIAKDLGCSMAQLGLAWCLKNPHVSTVMTGASRPEQVVENMKAIDVVAKLDSGVMERIDEVLGNRPDTEDSG